MKKNTLKTLAAFALAATSATSMAADFTWQGNGGNWSVGANWLGGTAPSGTGHILYFNGATQTSINNQLSSVGGINFNAGAGAFTLTGNALTLTGDIVNNSASTQTISLDLALSGTSRIFNTRYGDLDVSGDISGSVMIFKEGLETLTLSGENTYTGITRILAGKLLLDASTGNISSSLQFGTAGSYVGNNVTLEVTGDNYSVDFSGRYNYAANKIIVGTNVKLTFGSYQINVTDGRGTSNFDVSAAGSSMFITSNESLSLTSSGRIVNTTVTDGIKTGFAIRNTNTGEITRLLDAALTDISSNPATSVLTDARLNGDLALTASKNLNSLTLQGSGGGEISGDDYNLTVREILMEEGAGDYLFSNARVVAQGSAPTTLVVHHYSTSGTLTFDSALLGAASTQRLVKTGQGTMVISDKSNSDYTGDTIVQDGRLELDGTLSGTGVMRVFDGATLVGGGSYGTSTSTTFIYAGGTLGGTSSRALTITGSLTLESDSAFAFTLGAGADFVDVSGAIALQDNVNLQLALNGAPTIDPEYKYFLIKSGVSITGNFVYNGVVITNGTAFSLDGYDFKYFQSGEDIWVQAIPEPSVTLLLGLGAATLLLYRRRH